jgi:hypothetical protein
MTSHILFPSLLAAAFSAGIVAVALAQHDPRGDARTLPATFEIPNSLKVEHEELHSDLSAATRLGGKTGAAAQRVATLLHAHFVSEEEFALPPLGLLRPLASGRRSPDMREVIALTDRLKVDLPRMLDEHRTIVAALEELARAAEAENRPEAVRFAERLTLHAQNEEEVLYPAAILVGEFLKLTLPH